MTKQRLLFMLSFVFLFVACKEKNKVSDTDTNYEIAVCEETEEMQTFLQCSPKQQLTTNVEVELEKFVLEEMENK
jgi:uncharacterized protein YpmS